MMWDGWMMPGYGIWGGIMMLVFWIAIIVGVVFLVKWLVDQSRTNQRRNESPCIGMGERYDVLFTANNPGRWALYTLKDGTPAGGYRL